ncbi:MAG: enoyl-CoA hydratase/isomerase family protein [Pseudomonadales bacterium]|nr:enoyl-CoA hydratase/isomerase family protein [Pseudomonadales bacterium]
MTNHTDLSESFETYRDVEAYFSNTEHNYVKEQTFDGTTLLTLNDPERLNCLSGYLTIQLGNAIERLNKDPECKAIIITGTGNAFSAGGDMALMGIAHKALNQKADEGATIMRNWIRLQFGRVARSIRSSEKLYISAVNGPAAGVGLAFVFASDLIYLANNASLVPAFGKIGLVPEVGSNWFLSRGLGYQKAFEYFLKGTPIPASTAYELGLINAVVDPADLIQYCVERAHEYTQLPMPLISMTKNLLQKASDIDWSSMIDIEEYAEAVCFTTQYHQRAVSAFAARTK